MGTWLLLSALVMAGETTHETDEADRPTAASTAAEDADEAPWKRYRIRPVVHPLLDIEFLHDWEPAFRRRNRMASFGAGLLIGGVGLGLAGIVVSNNGGAAGAPAAVLGGALIVAGPIIGVHGNLGAARILRASGISVTRGWAYAAITLHAASIFGVTALFTIPLATAMTLVQAEVNAAAFVRSAGHLPRRVSIMPTATKDGPGLALAGRW